MGRRGAHVKPPGITSIPRRVAHRLTTMARGGERIREGSPYCIRAPYVARRRPRYYKDRGGVVFQPDVYHRAVLLAEEAGSPRIVDLGCGNAAKLVELHPRFDVVGVDVGQNIARCRARFDFGTWVDHDLDAREPLPLDEAELRNAVLVVADVVEHLRHPERLLGELARVLSHAAGVLISTPERDLVRGVAHNGPPPNPAHVREWNIYEFSAFLAAVGLRRGSVELTRSTDTRPDRRTILATVLAGGPPLRVEP
jgi:SAM-dependent methyltransferase